MSTRYEPRSHQFEPVKAPPRLGQPVSAQPVGKTARSVPQTLAALARSGTKDWDLIRRIITEVFEQLRPYHVKGLMYGKLGPNQVIVDSAGRFKLAPSPGYDTRSYTLDTDDCHVPPEVLHPEQFGPCGPHSEVYQGGMLILQFMLGDGLASAVSPAIRTVRDWRRWHASSEEMPPIAQLVPETPTDLAAIVQEMLRKVQHQRLSDAVECLTFRDSSRFEPTNGKFTDSPPASAEEVAPNPAKPYEHRPHMTWQRILRMPQLILHRNANRQREHLLIGLLVLSALLMLQVIAREQPSEEVTSVNPPRQPPLPRQDLSGAPTVNRPQLPNEPAEGTKKPVQPPPSHSTSDITAPRIELPVTVISTPSKPAATAVLPLAPDQGLINRLAKDPYADVRSLHYFPIPQTFEPCGPTAIQPIRDALQSIRGKTKSKSYPFTIPKHEVDPRATFALALLAYKHAQLDVAKRLCERSLKDAKHFDVPFILPIRLLNHIQLENGEMPAAYADCGQVLLWIGKRSESNARFAQAADEIAWWSGLLLGYAEDVRDSDRPSNLSLQDFNALVHTQISSTSWEKVRIARCHVSDTKSEATHKWKERIAAEEARRLALIAQAEEEARRRRNRLMERRRPVNQPYRAGYSTTPSYSWSPGQDPFPNEDPDYKNEATPISVPRLPPAAPSPLEFSTYYACAPGSLALQTLQTIPGF